MTAHSISPAFWRNKTVFLTGHTGFKGAWLSLWLHEMGAKVVGYALAAPSLSLFEAAGISEKVKHQIGDVRDLGALTDAMVEADPDIVMHFAAQSLVRQSYADPVGTFATNVMGTANLLEAMRVVVRKSEKKPRAAVIVTTDKCYRNNEWYWGYREIDPLGGHDAYSSSKACAELVAASFRSAFADDFSGVNIATARAGNVIGGGDWAADRLIPDAVTAFGSRTTVSLRNPDAIRPWQHVLDPLSGYLILARRLMEEGAHFAEAWNFGPYSSSERSVREVIAMAAEHWGDGAVWEAKGGADLHEAKFLKLDSSKAHSVLGWQPKLELRDAVKMTIDWYRAFSYGENAERLVRKDIQTYMARPV